MPNRPMATGTKPMPSPNAGMSSVMRGAPVLTSMPTSPASSPTNTIATAFSGAPCASTTDPTSPSTIRLKYSGALNLSASIPIGTLAVAITTVAIVPATNDAIAAMASAGRRAPAWPSGGRRGR